jgi:hypothetical protein
MTSGLQTRVRFAGRALLILAFALAAGATAAETWPGRTIKIVVPLGLGRRERRRQDRMNDDKEPR